MELSEVQRSIETYIKINWTETPIAYQNVVHSSGAEFIRATVLNSGRVQKSLGSTLNTFRMSGVLIVQVFCLKNTGTNRALFLADKIILLFQRRIIDRLNFFTPSVVYQGISDIYYQINVECPYYIDSIH